MWSLPSRSRRLALSGLSMLAVAGCSSLGLDAPATSGGSTLSNLLRYGSTTEPPLARSQEVEAADCPQVLVSDGHASIKAGSGQVSIANVARQCIERPDGSVVVKVGVEGRALLGPSGGSNHVDVPVTFVLRRGDRILASKSRRATASIPAGQAQGSFTVVEGDLVVPKGTGDFDIYVGLGGSAPSAASEGSRRRRG